MEFSGNESEFCDRRMIKAAELPFFSQYTPLSAASPKEPGEEAIPECQTKSRSISGCMSEILWLMYPRVSLGAYGYFVLNGRIIRNVLPFSGSELTSHLPPSSRTVCFTIASPRPETPLPLRCRFV